MSDGLAIGHCLCGAIGFEVDGEPLDVGLCHCESCRRHSGGVCAPFATFAKKAVRWFGAERRRFRSSPPVIRSFCGQCGSPLAYENEATGEEIDLYLGAFDQPDRFPVRQHTHDAERVAWFDTIDRTPRYRRGSKGEPPVRIGPSDS